MKALKNKISIVVSLSLVFILLGILGKKNKSNKKNQAKQAVVVIKKL